MQLNIKKKGGCLLIMLSADTKILDILLNSKKNGNKLLKHFKINYPDKKLAEENNTILIAAISSENNLDGLDFEQFTDLVEILITTKKRDNQKAIKIIKTVAYEICRLIMEHETDFPVKPVIRNLNPFFDVDLVLTRGQLMVQIGSEPVSFGVRPETFDEVCVLLDDDLIEIN